MEENYNAQAQLVTYVREGVGILVYQYLAVMR